MSFVFVSHASQDKPTIRHIVDALIAQGLKVWIDDPAALGYSAKEIKEQFHYLEAGGRYRDKIDAGLRQAGVVLVCWSQRAKEDRKVWHAEASVARTLQKLVACRIDDVDPLTLPDSHGEEHIPDVRPRVRIAAAAGWLRATHRDRAHGEIAAELAMLVDAVKKKMSENAGRRLERRELRDPFAPYLINRANQESALGFAIEEVSRPGGVRAFFVAGPENECPDEFLERLKRHTSPQRLKGRSWYQMYVEWPFERPANEFEREYGRRLALELGLPSTVTTDEIAAALAQRDRPVAVVSLMHAEEWRIAEPKRIRAWLSWWHHLSGRAHVSAIPILCLKMPHTKPGWKHSPTGSAPGATVSNKRIWRQAQRLEKASTLRFLPSLFFASRKTQKLAVPPLLHPVRRPDADRWIGGQIEIMSQDKPAAKAVLDTLFAKRAAARYGISLKEFADAMRPLFGEW